jgi:hypothetical protein
MIILSWWRGASGIAWANDANVKAKASAINLVIASLQLPVTKRNKEIMASELVDLIQIKQRGPVTICPCIALVRSG